MINKEQAFLKLSRFSGEELYPIEEASWNIYIYDGAIVNWCIYVSAQKGIQLGEDTSSLGATPNWELNYFTQNLNKESITKGLSVEIPEGYTDQDEWVSKFYYCEHEETNKNKIEVLDRDGDRLFLRLTGETLDVNYYDGSKPANTLLVEAWFHYNEQTM